MMKKKNQMKKKNRKNNKVCGCRKNTDDTQKRLNVIEKLLRSVAESMQKAHFYDYIQYISDEKRMMKRSFLLGMLKGVGAAVGFSLLGGLAIYILHLLAQSNLPYIADFISDIIEIIENTRK